MAGRPALYNSPEELEKAIEDYFNPVTITETKAKVGTVKREEAREPRRNVTISGLAYHLGFESRQSFYDYEKMPEYSYIIKKARLRVEISYEERLADPGCTGAIFALKNMGWKDKNETESKVTVSNFSSMETADLKKLEELLSKANA